MADQSRSSILEGLHKAIRKKESELSELDLMLADYHTEHSRLIDELRRLRIQLEEAEEAASPASEPQPGLRPYVDDDRPTRIEDQNLLSD